MGDWRRLLAYGERVRKIGYNETVGNVNPDIFSVIEDTRPQEYILPNLKSLVWKIETSEGLERSLLFLTPQLRCLTIEIGNTISQEDLIKFLDEISRGTRLTSLSITSPTRVPSNLARMMQQQTTLEKVSLLAPGCLSPSVGRWLSTMSSLRNLQLDVADRSDGVIASFFTGLPTSGISSPGSIFSPPIAMSPLPGTQSTILIDFGQEQGFKQLRHVSLTGEITSVTNFLSRVSAPLQTIELSLDEPDNEAEWKGLWTTISKNFNMSLRSIVITASGNSRFNDLIRSTARGENTARRLRLDGLGLFPFLTYLEVDLPESRIILDEDIERLAGACPNLEIVKLCPLSRWPIAYGPPKTTLAGLAPLIANCKRLHTLHMPIHAMGTKDFSLYDMEYSSRSLERLHVGHSWIDDPLSASILLSHLAPFMDNLKWFHEKNRPGYVETHNIAWTRVSEILPLLQRMRLHERKQANAKPAPRPPRLPTLPVIRSSSPPLKDMVHRAIQTKCPKADFSCQAKVTVRHKNISTKPYQHDQGINATPSVLEQAIEALPTVREQEIAVQPELVSVSTETFDLQVALVETSSQTDVEEFNEKMELVQPAVSSTGAGYVGQSAGYVAQIVRAVTPPILLHLFSFWSYFVMDGEKSHSEPIFSKI